MSIKKGQFGWYCMLACWGKLAPSEARLSLLLLPLQNGIAIPFQIQTHLRQLPGQLQPHNCCFSLHKWWDFWRLAPPGTNWASKTSSWVEVNEDNPHSSATTALLYNWTSNCVTGFFHIYHTAKCNHQQHTKSAINHRGFAGIWLSDIHFWRCDMVQEEEEGKDCVKRGSMTWD